MVYSGYFLACCVMSWTHACALASYRTIPEPRHCLQDLRWCTGPQTWSWLGCRKDPSPLAEGSWSSPWSSDRSGTTPCSRTSRCTQKTWTGQRGNIKRVTFINPLELFIHQAKIQENRFGEGTGMTLRSRFNYRPAGSTFLFLSQLSSGLENQWGGSFARIVPLEQLETSDFSPSTESLLVYCCVTAKLKNFAAELLRSVAIKQSQSIKQR